MNNDPLWAIVSKKSATQFSDLSDKEKILISRLFRSPDAQIFFRILWGIKNRAKNNLVNSKDEKEGNKIRGSIEIINHLTTFIIKAQNYITPKK